MKIKFAFNMAMILTLVLFLIHNNLNAQSYITSKENSISEFIDKEGYLNKKIKYSGSVDIDGWQMILGKNNEPRFIPGETIQVKKLFLSQVMKTGMTGLISRE